MTARLLLVLPVIALLAACTTGGAGGGDAGGGDSSGGDGGSSAAGCASYDGTEVAPFSSPLVLSAPAEGAAYGDGSALSWELDPSLADEVPQVSFYDNFIDGAIRDTSSAVLEEDPENTFTANQNIFDSDLVDQPGIAELFLITETDYEGGTRSGDKLILGEYCVTYKN
jgi:hypothetical protein